MIDFIVGLFYNHRYFRLAVKQVTYYCLVIYLFGLLLDLYLTKSVHLNFLIWSESFHENTTAIILLLVGITLLFMTISLYFYNQISQKKRIRIKLEDIAHIWTNEIDNDGDTRTIHEYKHSSFLIRSINDKVFKSKRLQRFNSENIINNIKYFKDGELYLINEILSFLDDNLKVSSVPTYAKDKENIYLDSQNYFKEHNDGKTNLELLSKISLVEHTINVTEEAIKEFKIVESEEVYSINSIHLATVIIAALAHDIGKIRSEKMLKNIGLDDVIIKEMHHVDLSIEYFKGFVKNLGVYEENEIVSKAIVEHHSSTQPVAKLSKLIFASDREARKIESKDLIKQIKEAAELTIVKYENETNEKINKEQVEKLKNQLAEKDEYIRSLHNKANETKVEKVENNEELVNDEVIEEKTDNKKQSISKEEYEKAKIIKKSKVNGTDEIKSKENIEFERLIDVIKNNVNTYTNKGNQLMLKDNDILDNPKEFLNSISDDKFVYLTYYGLRESFEKVEGNKINFEEMKNHRFIDFLKEHELIYFYKDEQYYGKFEIFCIVKDKELSASLSLVKIPLEKLNLDTDEMRLQKEKTKLKNFCIREAKK